LSAREPELVRARAQGPERVSAQLEQALEPAQGLALKPQAPGPEQLLPV